MHAISRLTSFFQLILLMLWQGIAYLLSLFLGRLQYQAPAWLRWLVAKLGVTFAYLRSRFLNSPVKALAALVIVVGLSYAGMQAYQWYKNRPVPLTVKTSITAPTRTVIEDNLPPNPVIITFDKSVAPLELVGKVTNKGIGLMPQMAGEWKWLAENSLAFQPATDWPVGEEYQVKLNKLAFRQTTLLEDWDIGFTAPKFEVIISGSEFYVDPRNAAQKKAIVNLNFSHPVDSAKLEKSITLKMRKASAGVLDFSDDNIQFVVSYDKLKLNAYIHSAPLATPKDDSVLDVVIDKNLTAARGGKPFEAALKQAVNIPGLYSLQVSDINPMVVSNAQNEPEQILLVNVTAAVHEKDMASHVKAWVLPRNKLNSKPEDLKYPYAWGDSAEITAAVLAASKPLSLNAIPAEREYVEAHSFKYSADVGTYIYVQVGSGLKSFGGYLLGKNRQQIVQIPPFPPELKILSQGSLLALSGERKVAVLARDLPGIQLDIGRVLPSQLQHLISQTSGHFSQPEFNSYINADNLTERFERNIPLSLHAGKAHYEALDLGEYLGKGDKEQVKRGIFLLTVRGYQPPKGTCDETHTAPEANTSAAASVPCEPVAEEYNPNQQQNVADFQDKRLIVVTDLGLIAKKELDGSQVIFVQSIQTGLPVAGASVEVVAKNGAIVFNKITDDNGQVRFEKLDSLQRERSPIMYLVKKAGDLSFLPMNRYDRDLDYSRFDTGGVANAANPDSLNAYLFSDRGIYRPGDTMNIGMIVKTATWAKSLDGLPLEAEVLDARGLVVKKQTIKLGAAGFNELSFKTLETSPTGTYTVNLYSVKDGNAYQQLGSVSVKVQEFLPDLMKVKTLFAKENTLYPDNVAGWLHPKDLKANINVQNLFGTAAENRRVVATLTLSPAYPAFSAYKDFIFYDPQRAKEGYSEMLSDGKTNIEGIAEFKLGLEKYTKATYQLNILAQAYEAGGGRSVSSEAGTLISEQPYLVAYKTDGDLNYISKASKHAVSLIAVNSALKQVDAGDLMLSLIERKYVSVLTKQNSGVFKYESRKKEVLIKDTPYSIQADGNSLSLDTETAGDFAYLLKNKDGLELNRVEYSVAGVGNVSRSLERNAELQLTLDKKDYKAGDEISASIRAPYVGAGLITIERDKVYAQQWFKVDTQASVQKITLPVDFEGNGYVTVQFVRDPSSDEIFTSPLSYGVVPFETNLDVRSNTLKLTAQPLVKPGQVLKMQLDTSKPARVVVFAVDEGILQVARYQNPNALGHFFQKRQLEVTTSQILDMILPEFKKIMAATAPGGDSDGALGKHLNPFKRKTDKPAVYWSGIVDVDKTKAFEYTVPETFSGKLRLLALAVNDDSIGVVQSEATVRGDFVLTPNAPLTVTPGDVFDVSVGLANNVKGSGKDAAVSISLNASPAFEVVGAPKQVLKISELREGTALYKLKVRDGVAAKLGSARLEFVASIGKAAAKLGTEISVRPATPHLTIMQTGSFKNEVQIPTKRAMFAEYRKQQVSVSPLPLVAAGGILQYLANYEHSCTEQLVSQVMPIIVLKKRPELLSSIDKNKHSFAGALSVLRARQNAQGGFGLWDASTEADEFASVYAVHMLLEARDRANIGEADISNHVPDDMLKKGLDYLQKIAASPADTLDSVRVRSYAAYLLTREGNVTTPILANLRATLDAKALTHSEFKDWQLDLTASYMAASYQLLQQQKLANELINKPIKLLVSNKPKIVYGQYYDDVVRNSQTLYLVAKHFPNRSKEINTTALTNIMQPISEGRMNTLSSSYAVLAFDAYADVAGNQVLSKMAVMAVDKQGKAQSLKLPNNIIPVVNFAPNTSRLKLTSVSNLPLFYAVTESGFDVKAPQTALKQGLEIIREYTDDKGVVIRNVTMGDEITVRIKIRAETGNISDVAIVDLLPGGFEPVLQVAATATEARIDASTEAIEGEGAAQASAWANPLGMTGWQPTYADIREDRVVFYGAVSNTVSEFTYKIKATNSGQFIVPPAYAESMYNRLLQARSLPSSLLVARPK